MTRTINFVVPAPPAYEALYATVIHSLIDPIRVHLPESLVSPKALPDAVNVHFFNEKKYLEAFDRADGSLKVFLPHGMADKQWRNGPSVSNFHYVCVSGPSWVKKMVQEGIPLEKILMVGFSKLDPLFQGSIKKQSSGSPKKTVLYAPTHIGSAPCTSFPAFMEYLDLFPKDIEVLSSVHPYHKEQKTPVLQELAQADAVISDASSVVYEALSLGIPVIFPDWLVKDAILSTWPESFSAAIYRQGIGYHPQTFEELLQQLHLAIANKLSPADRRFIDGILPLDLRGTSGKVTARELRKLAK